MKLAKTKSFLKSYAKLPKHLQKKVDKQLALLQQNIFHPGFNTKRMQGFNRWEIRLDKHYRMTFEKEEDILILRTVGPHDTGLGKK